MTVLGAVLDHEHLAVALDDLSLDLADFFVEQDLVGQFAIENLLTDLRDTPGTKRVGATRPAQWWLRLLVRLEQWLVGPLGFGRRVGLHAVEALENRPSSGGSNGHCFLHIFDWFVHLFSLSTAGTSGNSQ